MRLVVGFALTAGLTLAGIIPIAAKSATAQTRVCYFVGNYLVCVNDAPGGEIQPVADGSGSALGQWTLTPHTATLDGTQAECTDENGNPSTLWVRTFYPNDPTQAPFVTKYCMEPELPPPPPTAAEAWSAAAVPEPAINVNPSGLGATGVETWLWGDSAAGVPVSVSVRGYTVSGFAAPTEWRWNMGAMGGTSNPPPSLRAGRLGSPDDPAARYMYETKGHYTITHQVEWSGTFTVSGWGLSELTLDAGAIVVESSRPYQVVEIRSVRLPPDGSG